MDIFFRKAKSDDIDRLMELYGKTIWEIERSIDSNLKSGFEKSQELKDIILNDIKDKNTIILVAEIDNKIVGYVNSSIILLKEAYIEKTAILNEIAVDEDYQKQGVGKLLLDKCIECLKKKKVGYIKLSLFMENSKANNFYLANGFHPYSVNYRRKI